MKTILSSFLLVLLLISPRTYSAEFFSTGQVAFEDRLFGADNDVNDIVIQVKALATDGLSQHPNLEEILILINPVAAGATDNIALYLDHRFLGGSCSVAGFADGYSCENAGNTWTPDATITLHRVGGTDDLIVDKGYEIYSSVSEMFASCSKTSMINTQAKDCSEQSIAITIKHPGFAWGPSSATLGGNSQNAANGNNVTFTDDNNFNFARWFYIKNSSLDPADQIIKFDTPNSIRFLTPINTGFPKEFNHWFEAFGLDVVGKIGWGGSNDIDLHTCDPRVGPLTIDCNNALIDWFAGGIHHRGGGIDRTALPSALAVTDDITTSDFSIAQPDAGSGPGAMVWGPERWEPTFLDSNGDVQLRHIGQMMSESRVGMAAHGMNHDDVTLERGICDMILCAPTSAPLPPSSSGSTLAPPVLQLEVAASGSGIMEISFSAKNVLYDQTNPAPEAYNLTLKPGGILGDVYNYSLVIPGNSGVPCPSDLDGVDLSSSVFLTSESLLKYADPAGATKEPVLSVLTLADQWFAWNFSGLDITSSNLNSSPYGGESVRYYNAYLYEIIGFGHPAPGGALAYENFNVSAGFCTNNCYDLSISTQAQCEAVNGCTWDAGGWCYGNDDQVACQASGGDYSDSFYMNFNTFTDAAYELPSDLGTGLTITGFGGDACSSIFDETQCNSTPNCSYDPMMWSCSYNYAVGTYVGNKYCAYNVITDIQLSSVANISDIFSSNAVVSDPAAIQPKIVISTAAVGATCADEGKEDLSTDGSKCIEYSGVVNGEGFIYTDTWSGTTYQSSWTIPYALE